MHPQYTPQFHAFFARRVTISSSTGCWLWRKTVDRMGYGQTTYKKQITRTHRLAWELAKGPIPADSFILHQCDQQYPPGDYTYRLCCNPDHLKLGSHRDNMADMVTKGRVARGQRHRSAILEDRDIPVIRQTHALGLMGIAELGRHYGVAKQTIWNIVHRKTWTHVP